MATGLLDFVDALGLPPVDRLGWSMGGYLVQAATLIQPARVRRLILAATGPGAIFAGCQVALRRRVRLLAGIPAAPERGLASHRQARVRRSMGTADGGSARRA